MKFCISIGKTTSPTTPLLLEGDFIKSMETAKKLGFDAVEIHTPSPEELNIAELTMVRERLDMQIGTIGTGMLYSKYGLYLMDQNEERRNRLLGLVKGYIDTAAQLNSRVTIGSIKGNFPKDGDRNKYILTLGDSLQAVSEYAVQKGVIVLLEATNRFENNVLNTGKDLYQIITKFQLKNIMALMDSFHINIEESSVENCLADTHEYLGYIHFGDNTRCYPGSGAFDFDKFCKSIIDIGYDGILSVECFPQPDGLTAAKESIKFFKKYFS